MCSTLSVYDILPPITQRCVISCALPSLLFLFLVFWYTHAQLRYLFSRNKKIRGSPHLHNFNVRVPVSCKNGDSLKWGPLVPIFPGEWAPGSLYYRENEDPESPFSQKYGDPLVKMGTPCMADCFPRVMKTICIADHYHSDIGIPCMAGHFF